MLCEKCTYYEIVVKVIVSERHSRGPADVLPWYA